MIQNSLTVTANQHISGANYRMTLTGPEIAAAARPGQFVMVRPDGGMKPFLPRPFSIHRINTDNGSLELLYKIVGHGTRRMAGLASGDRLDIVGPLGNGFRLAQPFENTAFVAGGIGVAPLVFLADVIIAESHEPERVTVFIGAGTREEVLCRHDFTALNMDVQVSTDDGSAGYHGLVTELFEKTTQKKLPEMVFACGPPAMLHEIARITTDRGIPCQVSIETIMACGMGACLGCAITSPDNPNSYKHACRDGPVFFTGEIDLNRISH